MSMVKFQKADIVRKTVIFQRVAAFFILNIKYDTYTWQYAYVEETHQVIAKRNFVLSVRGGIFGDKPTAYYDFGEQKAIRYLSIGM